MPFIRIPNEVPRGYLENWDGIPWHEAPLPRRWHRCKAWTRGCVSIFTYVERCACGSIRLDRLVWIEKNQRRKEEV